MAEPTPPSIQLEPGQQPTPEQIQQIQAHMRADAERLGLTMEQYIEKIKEQAMAQQRAQMEAQGQEQHAQHQHQHQQQQQVQPGPPKPEALAVATFLRAQDLKPRTCIFQEKRKDMFRG
jgi:translocation protein SEC62